MMEHAEFLDSLKEGLIRFNPEIDEWDTETFRGLLNGISNKSA